MHCTRSIYCQLTAAAWHSTGSAISAVGTATALPDPDSRHLPHSSHQPQRQNDLALHSWCIADHGIEKHSPSKLSWVTITLPRHVERRPSRHHRRHQLQPENCPQPPESIISPHEAHNVAAGRDETGQDTSQTVTPRLLQKQGPSARQLDPSD